MTCYRYMVTASLGAVRKPQRSKFWDTSSSSPSSDSELSPSILSRKGEKEKPTESNVECELEPEPWEAEFEIYKDHLKFFEKLRNAQHRSNSTGKRTQICWRTFRTSIGPKPNNGKLEKVEYVSKLITALKNIRTPVQGEKEVLYNIFYSENTLNFIKKYP